MKTTISIIMIIVFCAACGQRTTDNQVAENVPGNSDKIEAYYFHFTARCITCKTIEAEMKKNLENLYPEHTKAGLITFQSLNLDEESARLTAKDLGVSGQTLLIVKGDQKINLTNDGFMYAVAKPDKFREIIDEKVDFLLTR